jgi:hypothetical protein
MEVGGSFQRLQAVALRPEGCALGVVRPFSSIHDRQSMAPLNSKFNSDHTPGDY